MSNNILTIRSLTESEINLIRKFNTAVESESKENITFEIEFGLYKLSCNYICNYIDEHLQNKPYNIILFSVLESEYTYPITITVLKMCFDCPGNLVLIIGKLPEGYNRIIIPIQKEI